MVVEERERLRQLLGLAAPEHLAAERLAQQGEQRFPEYQAARPAVFVDDGYQLYLRPLAQLVGQRDRVDVARDAMPVPRRPQHRGAVIPGRGHLRNKGNRPLARIHGPYYRSDR